ncbi:hypothetical protein [Variovorax sp. Root473]|uniref:hypothetical protein n=1 Tax=Variovorax sp. Root473 TaxID=1736541 RepID=UPI0006F63DE1|nr:hypothetical protein [Variovorax sp. Root473]KQX95776.1 hypothetical protein ASD34_00190 [Variovorax sp. Root473]
MNTDLAGLMEALRRTLSDAVAPELTSDVARGQLAAVHDILGKLAGMAVWDPQPLQAQATALREGTRRFAERVARAGLSLPAAPEAADLPGAEARVRELTDWLDQQGPSLPRDTEVELDTILLHALREQLLIERKRIPLTDFSAMTAAASKD